MVLGGVLLLAMEMCLPSGDLFFLIRVLYMIAWSVLVARLFEDFSRSVFVAEEQFRTFRWHGVTCHCCSVNHLLPDGRPIPCDREILGTCIVEWFGSVEAFDESVRTQVRGEFLGPVTRGFPLGFRWLIGANSYIAWSFADSVACRAGAGNQAMAISYLITAVAWWLWISPASYLCYARVAQWMERKRWEKVRSPTLCAVVVIGYCACVMNAGLPHLYFASCYRALADPVHAGLAFAGTTLCLAVAAYSLLAGPRTCRRAAQKLGGPA